MFDREALERIRAANQQWQQGPLAKTLKRGPEREQAFATSSGPVRRLYTPLDVAELDYERDLGFPGEFPFTRGVQATMYRGRLWTMRQYAGFGTAEATNERFKFLLGAGQTGLSCAFDLPTQMGLDSDHPRAEGEVGKVGVAIDSLADMRLLLADL
ncbi:MAG TPA: methylmalonyl-CoA mutase family protein, partial [Dehalococcoidia bacterium]|nr:methylmalonyl-CoA mutase family protein [Dehalococcoidia bacterium]